MNIVEKLLSFKFRSGYDADEKDHDDTRLEMLEKLFKIYNYSEYSYFDIFYNTLKTFKKLDKEYFKNSFDLKTYIEKMETVMAEFLQEMQDYESILSFDDKFNEDYTKIRDFGFLIIDRLKRNYEKLHEENTDVSTKHYAKRMRKSNPKFDDTDTPT